LTLPLSEKEKRREVEDKRWISTEIRKGERKVGVAKDERGARGDDSSIRSQSDLDREGETGGYRFEVGAWTIRLASRDKETR
jgi:hypothetical protein